MQWPCQAKWDVVLLLTAGQVATGNLAFGLQHTWDSLFELTTEGKLG